jgi:hypothetical protein
MRRMLSVIILSVAVAAMSSAQEAAQGAPEAAQGAPGTALADAPGKGPRAVYFAPARSAAALDREGTALLDGIPEMLATSIAVQQPIARSASAEAARSIITVAAVPAAGGVNVTVSLQEGGVTKGESAKQFKGRSLELAPLQGFIQDTTARFAPLLEPVDAPTDIQKLMSTGEFIETSREAEYLRQLDKRWEFTLWMSGVTRIIDSTGMDSTGGNYYFDSGLGPLIADATWFFTRDMGAQLSLYFNQTSAFDFGANSRSHASGIFIFPGVGFVYRTVGQISAQYTVTLSAGLIHVSADKGDVTDRSSTVVIPQGSDAWSAISLRVRLSPALVWCITPSIALKGAIAFDIIAPKMFPWFDSPLGGLQLLSIGLAYRL